MVDYTDDFSKKSENSKKSEATHSNTQGGSTLKRSASYIMLKNTCNNFRNKSLSKNKNDECESQKNETTENSRLNSKSPSKKLSSQNITASHQRIVSRIHKHNSDHMINPSQRETYFNAKRPGQIETNNVFELKKEEYEEESPLEQAPPHNTEAATADVSTIRALRYKAISRSSHMDVYPSSNKDSRESIEIKRGYRYRDSNTGSFVSNLNAMSSTDGYYQRRKQPRQARKYPESGRLRDNDKQSVATPTGSMYANRTSPTSSHLINSHAYRGSDLDEDVESNINDHSLEEAPLRQQIHHTKSTLRLLKINSECTPKNDEGNFVDINSINSDKSLEGKHIEYLKFEPQIDSRDPIYNSIRNVSLTNKSREYNENKDEYLNYNRYYDEPFKVVQQSSNQSTKPLALRKRNRDPYNPYSKNNDYKRYQNDENWPRDSSSRDEYLRDSRDSIHKVDRYLDEPMRYTPYVDTDNERMENYPHNRTYDDSVSPRHRSNHPTTLSHNLDSYEYQDNSGGLAHYRPYNFDRDYVSPTNLASLDYTRQ